MQSVSGANSGLEHRYSPELVADGATFALGAVSRVKGFGRGRCGGLIARAALASSSLPVSLAATCSVAVVAVTALGPCAPISRSICRIHLAWSISNTSPTKHPSGRCGCESMCVVKRYEPLRTAAVGPTRECLDHSSCSTFEDDEDKPNTTCTIIATSSNY
ncbi:hypothetical protein MRX96_022398 [Rhipicephalus microplus]